MRVGTWNLERAERMRAWHGGYLDSIETMDAHLLVLTEPGPDVLQYFPNAVCSPRGRPPRSGSEPWIALVGSELRPHAIELPYDRVAVAAWTSIEGRNVALYGSVLPWNAARSQAPDVYGEKRRPFTDVFDRALREQVEDVRSLQQEFGVRNVFWAGDFNHPLVGPLRGYSKHARQAIKVALDELGMRAFNAKSPSARPGACAIDLICGAVEFETKEPDKFFPTFEDVAFSDHGAYCVEIIRP